MWRNKNRKRKVLCCKKAYKIWNLNADNIVISKLVKTKTYSKYCMGNVDKVIRQLVLIMPKMSGYVKTFKVKEEDKDKNYKLMSLPRDNEKLLETYKAVSTKIEDF